MMEYHGHGKGWTTEEEKVLIAHVRSGESYSEIAAAMGRSRNACIGKAGRLGLHETAQGRRTDLIRLRPKAPPDLPKSVGLGKTLFELEEDECRWPLGDLFCGLPTEHRRSYCPAHDWRGHHDVQRCG